LDPAVVQQIIHIVLHKWAPVRENNACRRDGAQTTLAADLWCFMINCNWILVWSDSNKLLSIFTSSPFDSLACFVVYVALQRHFIRSSDINSQWITGKLKGNRHAIW
jgi:hypothetical protein